MAHFYKKHTKSILNASFFAVVDVVAGALWPRTIIFLDIC